MRLYKIFVLLTLVTIFFLFPRMVEASSSRIYSLSLNTNDYWILPDSTNMFSNPAYINLCPQSLEITAADYLGKTSPFSSLVAKIDDRITLGIALGQPHPSFYNNYCSNYPADTVTDFVSNVQVTSGSNIIIPEAGNIITNDFLLFFGYAFAKFKFGLSTSYITLNSRNITKSLPTEIRTTSHQVFTINTGFLTDSISAYLSAEFPSLIRQYSNITSSSSDIREINCTGAFVYKIGFAGTVSTSPKNTLIISANYSSSYFPATAFEYLDNDKNGNFTDTGDVWAQDYLLAQRYSIKIGLADRIQVNEHGFIFMSIYGNIYKFKQYATGYNVDGSIYDSSIHKSNRYTVPVILGGEMNLTDWLAVRISGTKNIVYFTKWYDESTGDTYTDFTSAEGSSFINAGIGIHYKNFTADLLLETPWSGNSDPLAGDYNDYTTTKLSLTWNF